MASFDEVLKDCTKLGTKIPTSEYLENGKYPIIDQGQNAIAGYYDSDDGLFKDVPAIVFGDHTRVVKYVDKPCFLGADGVKLLCPVDKDINCKYLFYQLSYADIPNTGYNRHFKWVKALGFKIPSGDEQNHVVEVLDKVTDLILIRKQQLEKLDELVKARFVEMFGTFPANPFRWSIGKIQDVVSDVRYGSSRPAVEGGKYPYLRMNNITYSGELDLRDTKRIDIPDSELDKCTVRRGDVLFNRTNSKELVGKTCVYNRDELMVLAGFVIRVRINERIRPEVLSAFLNMDFSKRMLIGMCKTAIGQANINAKELQNIDLYIPPIELQDQFVTLKNKIDQQKQTVQQSLEKLELMKKALMQEYFG